MRPMLHYALVASMTTLSTFCALVQVGKLGSAFAVLEIVAFANFGLAIACVVARRIWRRST